MIAKTTPATKTGANKNPVSLNTLALRHKNKITKENFSLHTERGEESEDVARQRATKYGTATAKKATVSDTATAQSKANTSPTIARQALNPTMGNFFRISFGTSELLSQKHDKKAEYKPNADYILNLLLSGIHIFINILFYKDFIDFS